MKIVWENKKRKAKREMEVMVDREIKEFRIDGFRRI